MSDRLKKEDFVRLLAARMKTDEATAPAWVDGVVETLYESFKDGKGVILPGFGGSYVRPEPESWVFKFNPGSDCARCLAGHRPIRENSRPTCMTRGKQGCQTTYGSSLVVMTVGVVIQPI